MRKNNIDEKLRERITMYLDYLHTQEGEKN